MARWRKGRKDAIVIGAVIPDFYPAIPGFHPVIPAKAGIQRVGNDVRAQPIPPDYEL